MKDIIEITAVLQIPRKAYEFINEYARSKKTHPDVVFSNYVLRVAHEQISAKEREKAISYKCPEDLLADLNRLQDERYSNWASKSIDAFPIDVRSQDIEVKQ